MYQRKKINEDDLDQVFAEAAKLVIAKKKLKGVPIAGYDFEKKRAYMEYPDGSIEYAEKA